MSKEPTGFRNGVAVYGESDFALQDSKAQEEFDRTAPVNITVTYAKRVFREEPDGPNDRMVDIYYNGKWIPAYFTDIKKGDFFLDINAATLDPGRCFFAASDCHEGGTWNGIKTFIIPNGAQIVTAPETKEIDITALPNSNTLLLE
jgi:hypothetical protein